MFHIKYWTCPILYIYENGSKTIFKTFAQTFGTVLSFKRRQNCNFLFKTKVKIRGRRLTQSFITAEGSAALKFVLVNMINNPTVVLYFCVLLNSVRYTIKLLGDTFARFMVNNVTLIVMSVQVESGSRGRGCRPSYVGVVTWSVQGVSVVIF